MFILYALARPIVSNTTSDTDSPTLYPTKSLMGICDSIQDCRTLEDIIWNCASVVFICVWVAIHPNVPKHGTSTITFALNNGLIMFLALIAPELIVLWAMRQWVSARRITERVKKYGWTQTHAFFLLMGGFALYDGPHFRRLLWEKWCKEDLELVNRAHTSASTSSQGDRDSIEEKYSSLLEYLLDHGFISLSEDEIQDRSHGDPISKAIALIQTSWFLLQCVARACQGLAITELEIITLAFSFLNFVIYFLWWNKPQRVCYPVHVRWPGPQVRDRPQSCTPKPKIRSADESKHLPRDDEESVLSSADGLAASPSDRGVIRRATASFISTCYDLLHGLLLLLSIPFLLLYFVLKQLFDLAMGVDDNESHRLFSSRLGKDPPLIYFASYFLAICFGGFHCLAWVSDFPSERERLQWRISSLLVTLLPLLIGSAHRAINDYGVSEFWALAFILAFNARPIILILVVSTVSYVVARLWLISLAFMALRDLPPSAYWTVQWTTFIPHIG